MEASRRFDVVVNTPDEVRINAVKAKLEDLFSGRAPSTNKEADFIALNNELFEACGCDLDRMEAEFNSCLGVRPDEPIEPYLKIAGEQT
jgi:hypothetical protein